MTSALKFSIHKEVGEFKSRSGAYHTPAETENVGVIMQTGVFCGIVVAAGGGAYSFNLVGGERHSDSHAA